MNLKQLRASVAKWRAKYAYRLARERYWIMLKRPKGIAKWSKLRHEAKDMIHRRLREIKAYKAKHPPKAKTASGEGYSVPQTTWNPYRKPIANWMIPILQWAHDQGWTGVVVSGVRSRSQQWIAAVKYGLWHYPHGNPFLSNHLKWVYPGGAVDVTNYEQLYHILKGWTGSRKLLWAGITIRDYVHFSSNGH